MTLNVNHSTHLNSEQWVHARSRHQNSPSGSEQMSLSPQHTEALMPRALSPAGQGQQKQEVSGKGQDLSRLVDDIRQTAEKANQYLELAETHLEFTVNDETGRVVVTVVDSETKEVVRRIPPETMIRFSERISEMRGLLFEVRG